MFFTHFLILFFISLAEIFKRPTTWKDYCNNISKSKCLTHDGIAKRRPINTQEESMYFLDSFYMGHFQYTDQNNCTTTRTTSTSPETNTTTREATLQCTGTGHFIDYPCSWESYFDRQAHWNNINLDNDVEYSYNELIQIFAAANATQSHIIIMWWTPHPLISNFFRVSLPPPTDDCINQRPEDIATIRCNKNNSYNQTNNLANQTEFHLLMGYDANAACDY